MSIPTENVHCLSHFLLHRYFFIAHTVIAQCILYVQGHCNHRYKRRYACEYDKSIMSRIIILFHAHREISQVVMARIA